MGSLKFLLGWMGGVIIVVLALGWFRNEGIDWALMFGMILGGIMGVVITAGIRKARRKEAD